MTIISASITGLFLLRISASMISGERLSAASAFICALTLVMILWGWNTFLRARRILDPAKLLALQAGKAPPRTENPGEQAITALWLGYGYQRRLTLGRDSRAPVVVPVQGGERIGIQGINAISTARWLAAQLLQRHQKAQLQELQPPLPRQTDTNSADTANRSAGQIRTVTLLTNGSAGDLHRPAPDEVQILVCANPGDDLTGFSKLLSAGNVAASEGWWQAFKIIRTGAAKPTGSSLDQSGPVATQPALEPRSLHRNWQTDDLLLRAEIGRDVQGKPVIVDLVEDGPHALLSGTTGSGKSEALLTWLARLCSKYSPRDLQILLIDYKGGSTSQRLAELPHVVGTLTDHQQGTTKRALGALTEELLAREERFAAGGCSDFRQYRLAYPEESLPRLLVVVDEMRELAQSCPDQLEALNRLAAQGRSLGLHLILATQRPTGAITSEIRANCPLRIALRAATAADSFDVLENHHAAQLPPKPGLAIVQRGQEERVQIHLTTSTQIQKLQRAARIASRTLSYAGALWQDELPEITTLPQQLSEAGRTGWKDSNREGLLRLGLFEVSARVGAQELPLLPGSCTALTSTQPQWLQARWEEIRRQAYGSAERFIFIAENLADLRRGGSHPSARAQADRIESGGLGVTARTAPIRSWKEEQLWDELAALSLTGKFVVLTAAELAQKHVDTDFSSVRSFSQLLRGLKAAGAHVILLGSPEILFGGAVMEIENKVFHGQLDTAITARLGISVSHLPQRHTVLIRGSEVTAFSCYASTAAVSA